jgi:Recombination endonuclease VII
MICSKCQAPKDESEFYKRNGKAISQCKTCHNIRTNEWYHRNRAEQQALRKERYKISGPGIRNKRIQKQHGVTAQQLLDLHQDQKDCCAICHKPEIIKSVLSLDHSHSTGQVRGLLCMRCNLLLGQANDDIMVLKEAIAYLEKWQPQTLVTTLF